MGWLNHIPNWWNSLNTFTTYVISVVVVLVAAAIVSLLLKWVLRLLIRRAESSRLPWDDVLVHALANPLRVLVWVLALAYLVCRLLDLTNAIADSNVIILVRLFWLVILGLVTWFLVRLANETERHIITKMRSDKKAPADSVSIRALSRLVKIVIWIAAALVGLGILRIPISGLLTFGGVGGIAIAIGSKDLLANFTGGLLVYLNKHFAVGDWIYSPDRQIEGTVEYIGWRLTRIRAFDKRPIYVPNAIFNNIIVINASRMSNRRIKQNIGVRYDDATKVQTVLTEIRQMLETHPDIDQNCTTLVNLVEFGSSQITFMIYTFTKTTNWAEFQNIQDDVMLRCERIISDCGAECAFPTTTLHVPDGVAVDLQAKTGR